MHNLLQHMILITLQFVPSHCVWYAKNNPIIWKKFLEGDHWLINYMQCWYYCESLPHFMIKL